MLFQLDFKGPCHDMTTYLGNTMVTLTKKLVRFYRELAVS